MHDPREPHLVALIFLLVLLLLHILMLIGLIIHIIHDLPLSIVSSWVKIYRHGLLSVSILLSEAEYRGVANAVAKAAWVRNLLWELHTPLLYATLVYCDKLFTNMSIRFNINGQKHIEIHIHIVCDMVATWQAGVLHVPSRYMQIYSLRIIP